MLHCNIIIVSICNDRSRGVVSTLLMIVESFSKGENRPSTAVRVLHPTGRNAAVAVIGAEKFYFSTRPIADESGEIQIAAVQPARYAIHLRRPQETDLPTVRTAAEIPVVLFCIGCNCRLQTVACGTCYPAFPCLGGICAPFFTVFQSEGNLPCVCAKYFSR
jgi:hypothetical protein